MLFTSQRSTILLSELGGQVLNLQDRTQKRRDRLIAYLRHFTAVYGYGPTFDEMQEALGYRTKSSVSAEVDELETEGVLVSDLTPSGKRKARSLRLVGARPVAADGLGDPWE